MVFFTLWKITAILKFLSTFKKVPYNRDQLMDYHQTLLDYGLHIHKDRSLVEDCIQDIYVLMCENNSVLNKVENLESYLKVSLRREIIKKVSSERKKKRSGVFYDIYTPSYEDALISKQKTLQRADAMKKALDELSQAQKSVMTLRFYRGYSYEEIAEKMGTSKRTVYNQVHDAMKKMRSKI